MFSQGIKKKGGKPTDAFLKEKHSKKSIEEEEEEKIGKKSESNSQTSKQGKYTVKRESDEAKLGVFNVIEQRNYPVAPTVISNVARK